MVDSLLLGRQLADDGESLDLKHGRTGLFDIVTMCYYDHYQYDCSDLKWSFFREHCQRGSRLGKECGTKTPFRTVPIAEKCALCEKIDRKMRRLEKHKADYQRWAEEPQKYKASMEKAAGSMKSLAHEIQQLSDDKTRRFPAQPTSSERHRGRTPSPGGTYIDGRLTFNFHTKDYSIDKYPAKSHAQRVAEKLGADKGLIVLQATPAALYPDSDQPMPFRQDRYFYYLTGCNEPDCYVTYDIGKDHLVLWLPPIDASRVVWSGRGSTVKEAMAKYDVDDAKYIMPSTERWHRLEEASNSILKHSFFHERNISLETLATTSETSISDAAVYKIERGELQGSAVCRMRGYTKDRGAKLKNALNSCRVIKDEYEIGLIRKANKISADAHTAVLKNLHSFTNEAQVEAAYTAACIAQHAKQQAYSPIAGSGPNAGVLHYVKNDEDFGDRQMMVLDAGCEVSCYASDVTRSFPLNSKRPGHWPSKEAEDVYRIVEQIQEACIEKMKPGNRFLDIARLSARMALDGLLELGILKGDREEIWEAGTEIGFYPHGLGHHLGLEVHDVSPPPLTGSAAESQRTERSSRMPPLPRSFDFRTPSLCVDGPETTDAGKDRTVLKPGMVITIEPGLYFNSFLLDNFFFNNPKHSRFIDRDVLDRYMPVGGVRIEDDILITEDGYENLTTALKGEEMLRCIRDGAAAGALVTLTME